jgi:hypothetical protein
MSVAQASCYNSSEPLGKITTAVSSASVALTKNANDIFYTRTFNLPGIYMFTCLYGVSATVANVTGTFIRINCLAGDFNQGYSYPVENATIAVGTGDNSSFVGFFPISESGTTVQFVQNPLFGGGTLARTSYSVYIVKVA